MIIEEPRRIRRMLGLTLEVWNGIMIGSLVAAAVAAGAVGASTWVVVRLTDQTAKDSEEALTKYKAAAAAETENAKATAATADLEAAKANERAAALEKEAATAQLELQKIKKEMAPRELTTDEKTALVQWLLSQGKKFTVEMGYISGDLEAQDYARQILLTLRNGGLNVPALHAIVSTHIVGGISLNGPDSPEFQILGMAFNRASIPIAKGSPHMPLGLTIGPKIKD